MQPKEAIPTWKIISRAAGLTIVFVVLVLLVVSEFTGRAYNSLTAETLLVIAGWLIGGPSLVAALKGRSGSG